MRHTAQHLSERPTGKGNGQDSWPQGLTRGHTHCGVCTRGHTHLGEDVFVLDDVLICGQQDIELATPELGDKSPPCSWRPLWGEDTRPGWETRPRCCAGPPGPTSNPDCE